MKTKRILSLLLSLAIILSMAPVSVFAEDVTADTDEIISRGIASSEEYLRNQLSELHADGGVTYGFEWYIIAMLRAGKDIDSDILDEYYESVKETVSAETAEEKPTDTERAAIALAAMGMDITSVEGANLAERIYNSTKLSEGANELAYALIALDAQKTEIPEDAVWSREKIVDELLKFQLTDGSFGLYDTEEGSVDMTAICLQALAPYMDAEKVKTAADSALSFLKSSISEDCNYADNPNSTAAVLFALSALKIDVTDEANGFGDAEKNIVTALSSYKNPDGNGYLYGGSVNSMATVQVMQAYDAYRKAHKENVDYWDFSQASQKYDDVTDEKQNGEEAKKAEPAVVYVSIISEGDFVTGKDGNRVAQAPVTVTDRDENGALTVDEALYAVHETYYEGGAEDGYASYNSAWGMSVATLWGKGSTDAPASVGYWLNNTSCYGLNDEVKESDYLTAFNYYDAIGWSDKYSYFTKNEEEASAGESVSLELIYQSGYDEMWNPVFGACEGANVVVSDSDGNEKDRLTTDADGKVKISLSSPGEYFAIAYKDDHSIVPAICKITVTAQDGGTGGGNASNTITVSIMVADPQGETYLPEKAYSVKKGTTVFELIKKTGLDVEFENSAYGVYIKAIEGLSEFDGGSKSGWMYSVNGEYPSRAVSEYTLSDKDYVELLYTRELGADIGDNSYGGLAAGGSAEQDYSDKEISEDAAAANAYVSDTAEYLYETVSNPQVSSVGGEWTVLGLARSGEDVPEEYFETYYRTVEKYVKDCEGILHKRKYTEYSRLIIALTAIGKNPADVAGYNLLMPLGDYEKTIWQGVNGSIWALIALDCGNYEIPQNAEAKTQATREMYINHILEKQTPDGGWALSGETADPDVTAMALSALGRYRADKEVAEAVEKALACMSARQNADGGFSSGGIENAESTAQMLIALCTLGISPSDLRFVKNGNTITDALLAYYEPGKGFRHTKNGEINLMAAEQSFLALVAEKRAREGKNGLYSMEDEKSGQEKILRQIQLCMHLFLRFI